MRFRPSPWVTLLIAACVVTQLGLASWQWGRHVEQAAQLEDISTRIRATPASNADMSAPTDALIWRKAALTGTFEPTRAFITGRFEFGEPGFDVLGVLAVDGGPRLLVNRGWIPMKDWQTHASAIGPGPASVEGLLLPADENMVVSGWGRPSSTPIPANENGPERWAGPMWPEIRASIPGELLPVVLYEGPELTRPTDKRRDPLPAQGWIARPKHIGHLEYVGQWVLIACVFTGGWVYTGILRGRAT